MSTTISGIQSNPVGIATFGSNLGSGLQGGGLNTGVAGNYQQAANIAPATADPTYISNAPGGVGVLGDTYGSTSRAIAPSNASLNAGAVNQLNAQLGQLDPQLNLGLQNIGNSFNLSANRLDQQKAVAQRNYDTSQQQNQQSYLNNRNSIVTNTSARANALQRLLGMNGAGNSSAAYEQAPYAAGLQGSTELSGAQQTYGNNRNSLDTNWQDTQRNYQNSIEDLNNQKYQQENSLRSSIAQSRASLLNQIGQANGNPQDYAGQVNDLLSQITNLGQQYASPVLRAADVSYAAPTMSNYFLNSGQAAAAAPVQSGGGAASDLSPTFLSLLAGNNRDQFGNITA